ncbi:MAG: tetratricopeptide repeat protein, partial [Pseudomonadota bacterium]
ACTAEHARGCSNLGMMHRDGRGVALSLTQAEGFLRQGCTLGHGRGCSHLGDLLFNASAEVGAADLLGADLEGAAEAYDAACTAGHARGCLALGAMIEEGLGRDEDPASAAMLVARACDLGSEEACAAAGDGRTN